MTNAGISTSFSLDGHPDYRCVPLPPDRFFVTGGGRVLGLRTEDGSVGNAIRLAAFLRAGGQAVRLGSEE